MNVTLFAAISLSLLAIGCGRANPRLASISADNGSVTTSFSYEDDGRPFEIASQNQTLTFSWDGDVLIEVIVTTAQGPIVYALEQEGGRPTAISIDEAGETTVVEYDDAGRLSSINGRVTRVFTYADDGSLQATAVGLGADGIETRLEYEAGRPTKLTSGFGEQSRVTTPVYDAARLASLNTVDEAGVESNLDIEYDDDGRMIRTTSVLDFGEPRVVELEYEAADAKGIDLAPEFLPFFLWDLRGAAFNSPSLLREVLRTQGISW